MAGEVPGHRPAPSLPRMLDCVNHSEAIAEELDFVTTGTAVRFAQHDPMRLRGLRHSPRGRKDLFSALCG